MLPSTTQFQRAALIADCPHDLPPQSFMSVRMAVPPRIPPHQIPKQFDTTQSTMYALENIDAFLESEAVP
jgi:hypothetical protein